MRKLFFSRRAGWNFQSQKGSPRRSIIHVEADWTVHVKMSPVSHKWFQMESRSRAVLIGMCSRSQEPAGSGRLRGSAVKTQHDVRGEEIRVIPAALRTHLRPPFCHRCWNAVHMHSGTADLSSALVSSCLLSPSARQIKLEFHSVCF